MSELQAQITIEGRDNASAAIKEVSRALEETKGSADKASESFLRIKDGFESGLGFAAGITGFRELKDILEGLGDATVNFNGMLEETTMRLENLTGSAQGAAETIGRIKDLSDASPFTFKELETANERLLRFNFSTERAAELIKIASDAAAGMGAGASGVDTITEAFGRMNSRTELTTRGIMSLIAMGVPAYDLLAKGMGITTLQAEDLTKKGLIPSIDAIQILSSALETKYPEMAATIGGSFNSLKKTIADTMDFMFAELGKPVFAVLEASAKEWLAWLQSPGVKQAISSFANGLADALTTIGAMFNALKGPVGDFANEVKAVAGGALQFVAEQLANAGQYWSGWAAQAGDAGRAADDALSGTSAVVESLQYVLQGNFLAAWKDAGNAADSFGSVIESLKHWLDELGIKLAQRGVVDDLRVAWSSLKDAGVVLWGLVGDSFVGTQQELNGTLSASETASNNAAIGIKNLTRDIKDLAQNVREAVDWLKPAGATLDAVNAASKSLSLAFHNELITAIKDVLSPLQMLADAAKELELLLEKTFHIKIDIPGVDFILEKLGQIHTISGLEKDASGVGGPGGIPNAYAGSAAASRPSQFSDPQLSADEALAACGPAALVAFMKSSGGKVPTLREAANIAGGPGIGWTADAGMGGPGNEQKLLGAYGLSSTLNLNPSTEQIQTGANSGAGEIISTLGHYFTASGFNADTGKYDVGTSGSDLKGGSASMRLDEMISLEGAINGLLTDIKSTSARTADSSAKAGSAASKDDLIAYARGSAERAGMSSHDTEIFLRQIQQESGFDPSAKSGAGAIGIAQFMPGTAKGRGLDATDPLASLDEAAKYDAELLKKYGGNWEKALSAYNAGEGHVDSGAPNIKQTSDYLDVILGGANTTGSFTSAGGASNSRAQDAYTLNAAQLAELAKKDAIKKAATGDAGYAELGKLTDTTGDWLTASQTKEDKRLTGLDTTAEKATAKVGTDTADKIADLGTQRDIAASIKTRKDALAEQIADETRANQIAVAADALRWKRTDEDQKLVAARAREDDNILHSQQLAHEALLHSRTLQDTELQYQHGLQLEATAHARTLEDEKILDNEKLAAIQLTHSRQLQDEQTLANEKLAINQTAHQRQLQDQALADGEALSSTATAHSRQLQDTEAAYQLNRSIGKNPANEAALRTAAADAADQLAHQRGLQDVEQRYQDGLKDAALAKSRQDAEKEQAYRDQLADTALQTSRSNADKEAVYQQSVRATALLASRKDADVEAVYKEGLAKTALEHSRGLQDVEVQYQMGLAHTALMRKRDEEDAVRAEARAKEDADIAHKIQLDAAARAFAKAEKDKQDALDKILADEAFQRQKDQLLAEADITRKNIADKLVLDKQAVIEAAQAERDIKKASFDEQAATIIAKSKAAVETAGGDFAPIEAKMLATVKAMDDAFATSHANSGAALVDLAAQAVAALGANGKVPTAVLETANALTTQLGEGSQATQAIEVSDRAVELFGQQFGLTWEQARPLLGQIEQGIYTNLGENGLIPKHLAASDSAVEKFAHQWGISWDEARPILETESTRIKATFGTDVPDAMGKSGMAAIKLNTDIQAIKDKTVTVTTEYKNSGKSTADLSGANSGYAAAGQNFAVSSISDPSRSSGGGDFSTYEGRQAYRDTHPGSVVDASGAYTPPGRASGGPVLAGKAYMVGELGPELFTPGASSGSITPNSGAIDYERLARAIAAEMQNVNLTIGVDDIHSGLLRKSKRGGALGLA